MDRHIPLPVSTLVYANLTMKRAGCCPKAYPHISVVGLILQIKLVQNEHGPSGRSYPLTLESFDPCRQSFVTSVAIRSTCSYFLHFCLTLPALPFCPLGAAGLLAEERTMENGKWKMELMEGSMPPMPLLPFRQYVSLPRPVNGCSDR